MLVVVMGEHVRWIVAVVIGASEETNQICALQQKDSGISAIFDLSGGIRVIRPFFRKYLSYTVRIHAIGRFNFTAPKDHYTRTSCPSIR